MSQDTPFSEYLDDYYAECDEHLTAVRRDLLELESLVDQPHADLSLLDGLLRGLHTIKGLSGMVSVTAAEQLAHQMESVLRALRRAQLPLTIEATDLLIAGASTLEQVITALRLSQPTPDVAPVMAQLEELAPDAHPPKQAPPAIALAAPSAPSVADKARLAAARHPDAQLWLFEFTPASELAARGITVDVIRSRLQQVGELVNAAPCVTGEGNITFEFLVAGQVDKTDLEAWSKDGLSWTPYQVSPPHTPTPPGKDERTPPSIAPSSIVRVDLARLDDLMRMVGDLVITRARLVDNLQDLQTSVPTPHWRALQEINMALERQLRELREGMMRVRMVPIGQVFERMQFVARDLARESQKRVTLELSGQETEVDKLVVERMMDPLMHLVRNAVSHALEAEQERLAQDKPAEGKIALRAATVGDTVVIEVEDDGRGIDQRAVAKRAQAAGLIDKGTTLDANTLLDVLCAPGFSTREQADRASGRGVGMSVVRDAVQDLGGSLALDTQPGRGTRFSIQLPLTLAIIDALIVSSGGQTFAAPLPSVREVIRVTPSDTSVMGSDEFVRYRDGVLPIMHLAHRFGLVEQFEHAFYTLIVGSEPQWTGIAVDRVLGQREIVVRAISDPFVQAPGIAGATELGDGRPILILDTAALIKMSESGT